MLPLSRLLVIALFAAFLFVFARQVLAASPSAVDALSRATTYSAPPPPILTTFEDAQTGAKAGAPAAVLMPSLQKYRVGVVASDEAELAQPVSRDSALTPDQVLAMVRRAVDLSGGMAAAVAPDARQVLIKVNAGIVKPSGSGVNTDTRLVRAVAILVHEVAPQARILIGEGAGGWISPTWIDSFAVETRGWPVVDGFEVAGHRATAAELRGRGIDIECFDLNFDRALKLVPPGGPLGSMKDYELAATVLEADAFINCPVAKTHGSKITCALKNQYGLFPGLVYGWNKSRGTHDHHGIPHAPRVMDETFVDLLSLTQPDLNVVDMIAGAEGGAFQGKPKRANIVVAGRNAVAADLVAATLMGFNPDDFEFADLAWQRNLGPANLDAVDVRGTKLERVASRYKKAAIDYTSEWSEHAAFGMGVRRWTLLGPLPSDHSFSADELRALEPKAGVGDWSKVVFFGDDRIDLDKYYDDPTKCAVYGFSYFTMARSDSVRLWVHSDEDLTVWIDGQQVYDYQGERRHRLGGDRPPLFIEAGVHRLLVRAGQTRGSFQFSLNICEPIDDLYFAGNRYPGLRYYVDAEQPQAQARTVAADHIREDWYEPYFASDLSRPDPVESARQAADSVFVEGASPPPGQELLQVAAWAAGLGDAGLDSLSLTCLSRAPFHMGWNPGLRSWYPAYPPAPGRLLSWLGLGYDIRSGDLHREALKTIHGWLAQDKIPLSGFLGAWSLVDGSVRRGDQVRVHAVNSDTVAWVGVESNWWSPFPGGQWRNTPVVLVEASRAEPDLAALVDSVAALALEMGLQPFTADDPEPWGTRLLPAGLNAWDAWVISWERLPLSLESIAADHRLRNRLRDLGRQRLPNQISQRRLAAAFFAQAAQQKKDGRQLLEAAATAYGQVADRLEAIIPALPSEDGEDLSGADQERVAALAEHRGTWRQARDAERRALAALAEYLGRPGLPPAAEDPLCFKDQGHRLLIWRAELSVGIYELVVDGQEMQLEYIFGRWPEDYRQEVVAALPQEPGWQVAIEPVEGDGYYHVLQQPEAANNWQAVIRIDDGMTWQNRIELVLWAVPKQ